MVFGGHVTAAFDNPWLYSQYNPLRAFLDGHAAVIFFFMLSGYFYYTNQCISLKKYAKLLVKRVLHLTPPPIGCRLSSELCCVTISLQKE